MEVKNIKIEDLKPYEKNPRKNDEAVQYVAESIKQFGFKVPIIIDKNNTIVAGHTRYKAAEQLGLKEVPCIVADDLTDAQIKAFRLADNKVSEKSSWDLGLLGDEIKELKDLDLDIDLDLTKVGFGDFEISMLTEDMEPEKYDEELIEEYSSSSDDFLANKRIIIIYKTEEETEFLKKLIKEENDLNVVYKIENIMEKFDE